MCAIGGILVENIAPDFLSEIKKMAQAMKHRGPDGEGFYSEKDINLCHRLLKISSLESSNVQPLTSHCGKWVMSFNGEVYNHHQLRLDLSAQYGSQFLTQTDTEVLLEGWVQEGIEFLNQVRGVFAIALWSVEEKKLFLIRDRLGEKPLYFARKNGAFFFASEIKGLLAAGIKAELNAGVVDEFLSYRYVSGPETLFLGISKVRPGHVLEISKEGFVSEHSYWKISWNQRNPMDLEEALVSAVMLQAQSSFTPGLFLSGGVDSSGLAALMPSGSYAFTYKSSFTQDESKVAQDLARKYGHHWTGVESQEEWQDLLDQVIVAIEEPIGDSITHPTFQLFREVKGRTPVILTGEGADEIFGGYVHHFILQKLWTIQKVFGNNSLKAIAWILKNTPFHLLGSYVYPAQFSQDSLDRLARQMEALSRGIGMGSYLTTLSDQRKDGSTRQRAELNVRSIEELIELDLKTWLPDYSLLRTEKLAMSFGIETRAPYLDHQVVECALSGSFSENFKGKSRKQKLRRALSNHLDPRFLKAPKIPFVYDLSRLEPNKDFLVEKRRYAHRVLRRWAELHSIDLSVLSN